jgi:hypothetical protein
MSATPDPYSDYFYNHKRLFSHKIAHYFPLYHRHLKHLRKQALSGERKIKILEIGVQNGGSLETWVNYFGKDNVSVYGMDVDPRCKEIEKELHKDGSDVTVFIGDQSNRAFLGKCLAQMGGTIDAVVDDGGHQMDQQITSFEVLYPAVSINGGIYICEDVMTSYWTKWGGSPTAYSNPKSGTFMEYIKRYIDHLMGFYFKHTNPKEAFTKSTLGMHFYDGMVIIEKGVHTPKKDVRIGKTRLLARKIK